MEEVRDIDRSITPTVHRHLFPLPHMECYLLFSHMEITLRREMASAIFDGAFCHATAVFPKLHAVIFIVA